MSPALLLLVALVSLASSASAATATIFNNISRTDVNGNVIDWWVDCSMD
jgi:hypothetical protein